MVFGTEVIELLDKEIPKYKNKMNSLHLCFSTDPFMYEYDEIKSLSLEIIKRLNENGIKCTALTKGVLPAELSQLSQKNEYGITLISLDEQFRSKIELGSAPYKERIDSLRYLHNQGCKTWVSIEPYPTPNIIEQNFDEILEAVSFVDKIIFGRTNYNATITKHKGYKEFYNILSQEVIDFCTKNNKEYHIKNGTITEYMGGASK